jgi:hypothetical protein
MAAPTDMAGSCVPPRSYDANQIENRDEELAYYFILNTLQLSHRGFKQSKITY